MNEETKTTITLGTNMNAAKSTDKPNQNIQNNRHQKLCVCSIHECQFTGNIFPDFTKLESTTRKHTHHKFGTRISAHKIHAVLWKI